MYISYDKYRLDRNNDYYVLDQSKGWYLNSSDDVGGNGRGNLTKEEWLL